jgi:tRNA U34 2-thiouridine synthase MnmA/TrmU
VSGRTPNPCVECNRTIKFGVLLQRALGLGMDRIATGHYARIEYDGASGRYLLKKAADVKRIRHTCFIRSRRSSSGGPSFLSAG